jgi:hypothetical protein
LDNNPNPASFLRFEGAVVMSTLPRRNPKVRRHIARREKDTSAFDPETTEKLWLRRGAEDVAFQREAQVTWWSVLGGIAVAALLTEMDSLPLAFRSGSWYVALYFLSTCLVIVNSWVQTAWGSLILKWPLSLSTSTSLFFLGISLSVAGLNITRPAVWYAAMSVVLLTGLYNQLVFSKNHAWVALSADLLRKVNSSAWMYVGMTVFGIASSIYLTLRPSRGAEMGWGIVAFMITVLTLIRQHFDMTEEKRRMGIA